MYVTIILFYNLNFYLSILVFSVVKVGGVILISIFSLIIKLYKYYNKSTNKVLKGCCDGEGGGRREEGGARSEEGGYIIVCCEQLLAKQPTSQIVCQWLWWDEEEGE